MNPIIGYKKGAGGGSSAVEAPDSARSISYARVLDLLSEGEIEGPVNGLKSVFLDGTALQNADGTMNFSGATVEFRPGSQDQGYIAGFPAVENEITVGVELRSTTPYSRAATNLDLSAMRIRISTPQFQKADTATGSVGGYRVDYRIEVATDGGAYEVKLRSAFAFKVSAKYERSHRIDLPPARSGWIVRVVRETANANSATIADTMTIESVTEVIDAKLRYPNTALAGMTFDASQFQRVPTRSYHMRGRRIKVPSNYDPTERKYIGAWDGTFKIAYSNNPAWVFYDLALHPRYGMGHRVKSSQLDRYELYRIAQYCDELVPDGKGGQEPRMTCNVYLQTRGDATKVLNDLASVFRGMTYWSQSQVWAVADMPADPVYTYTAGNVIGGKFARQGTGRKTRYTVALVSWSDPANHYQQVVEQVEDRDGKLRYGVRQTEFTGIGCTSQGQAQRFGKFSLLTSRMETQEIAFSVGLDGVFARPGQVVRIADSALAGRPISGRISAVAGRSVTVDRDVVVKPGDTLIANLPSGRNEVRVIQSVAGRVITVSQDWSAAPMAQAVWAVEGADIAIPLYRIVSVAERRDEKTLQFEIRAVQHEPGKFDNIDFGTRIDSRPVSVIPPAVQAAPTNVRVSTYSAIDQGIAVTTMVAAWDAAKGGAQYEIRWRKDNGDWILAGRTGATSFEVPGIYAGQYVVQVVAFNALGLPSLPAFSAVTDLQGKTTPPPVVTMLKTTSELFGVGVEWGFPEGAADTQRSEVWYSQTPDRERAQKLGDFAYPQNRYTMIGLRAGAAFYFWVRLVDRSGNVGGWYPDGAGVYGEASADATPVLGLIAGQVDQSALTAELRAAIDSVPGIAKQASENAAAIVAEAAARSDQIAAESAQRASESKANAEALAREVADRAAAVAAEAQARGAAVSSETEARQSADESLGRRVDEVTAAVGGAAAAVTAEAKARSDADGALGERINAVVAKADGNAASIVEEAAARASADASVARRVDGLEAKWSPAMAGDASGNAGDGSKLVGVYTERDAIADAVSAVGRRVDAVTATVGKTSAFLTVEQTARVNADGALGQRIDVVSASTASNAAAITAESTARTDADGALGRRVDAVTATAGANAAAITAEASARASADAAVAKRVDGIEAKWSPAMAGDAGGAAGDASKLVGVYTERDALADAVSAVGRRLDAVSAVVGRTSAFLTSEQVARVNADGALGQRVDVVSATVTNAAAAIRDETTARAGADEALGQRITTLQATMGDVTASVQQNAQAVATLDGKVQAYYTVKVQMTADGKLYGAGMAIGIDNSGGVPQSQVLFQADRFGLVNVANGKTFVPFVVQGGQTFISQAFIGQGWITTGHIADAQITAAKIQDASITNAKIGYAAIDSAKIQDGAINSAKIQYAAIQTAHIGQAQIDTLRIGPNAVTTLASWGVAGGSQGISPVYTASGGTCMIIVDTSQVTSGTVQYWPVAIAIAVDGVHVKDVTIAPGGNTPAVAYGVAVWQGYLAPGNHTIQCFTIYNGFSGWAPTRTGTINIFEAKR
ncbi:phage tail protein [Burkholderia gladioli]|uniref:phage tail protein n=1 Tax=Burkholderia gladioli TaxID=28095 RepID=UPI001ABB829D|nr:phage tail protein [Burkholderia gladioli]